MNKSSILLCAAVAGLMASAHAAGGKPAAKAEATGECSGVNTCKGTGECGSKEGGTSCKGTNTCKGHGWVTKTEKDCKAAGGKWAKK